MEERVKVVGEEQCDSPKRLYLLPPLPAPSQRRISAFLGWGQRHKRRRGDQRHDYP